MSEVNQSHDEKETLAVDVILPGHEERGSASALFTRSKLQLAVRDGNRCWICGRTSEQAGPLEAHHYPIERSLALGVDWDRVRHDCEAGEFGITSGQRAAAKAYDWTTFDPKDPYPLVDNMLVNGLLLDKDHHTHLDTSIHMLPHPLWVIQRYLLEGYKYTADEVIHHAV